MGCRGHRPCDSCQAFHNDFQLHPLWCCGPTEVWRPREWAPWPHPLPPLWRACGGWAGRRPVRESPPLLWAEWCPPVWMVWCRKTHAGSMKRGIMFFFPVYKNESQQQRCLRKDKSNGDKNNGWIYGWGEQTEKSVEHTERKWCWGIMGRRGRETEECPCEYKGVARGEKTSTKIQVISGSLTIVDLWAQQYYTNFVDLEWSWLVFPFFHSPCYKLCSYDPLLLGHTSLLKARFNHRSVRMLSRSSENSLFSSQWHGNNSQSECVSVVYPQK